MIRGGGGGLEGGTRGLNLSGFSCKMWKVEGILIVSGRVRCTSVGLTTLSTRKRQKKRGASFPGQPQKLSHLVAGGDLVAKEDLPRRLPHLPCFPKEILLQGHRDLSLLGLEQQGLAN